MDLDEVADELYDVHPDEFIALRKALQDQARAEGDPALAKDIGGLPKPSTAAWVSNVLVREHRDEIEALVELGGLLREAQERLAGDEMRALNAQRSQLLGALTRQALAVARRRGHPVSTSIEAQVEDTLRAAMADTDAGEALLTGRLTSPMSYSGLGTASSRPPLRLVRTPKSDSPPVARRESRATTDRQRERERRQEEERRAAQERRRRELAEARRAADEATAAAQEAADDAAAERAQVAELAVRQQELTARLEQLRAELVRAEHAVVDAAAEHKRAERRLRNAQRAADDAASLRDRAVARADELARRVGD